MACQRKHGGQMAIYFEGEYKNHITNQVIGTCIMQEAFKDCLSWFR